MSVTTANFNGDPSVGLYGFATEEFALIGHIEDRLLRQLNDSLDVKVIVSTVAGTNLAGIFSVGNSNGLILPEIAYQHEIKNIEKKTNVLVLKGKYTALGNLILINDKGCLVSERLSKHVEEIGDFLKVKVETAKIAGLDLVGALAVSNNKGCVVHKETKKKEVELIENILKVKTGVATVNFGSAFVKSGIIANSKGMVVGNHTSGPELERIVEVLEI